MYVCTYILTFYLIIIVAICVNMWESKLLWLDIANNTLCTGLSIYAYQLGVPVVCTYIGSYVTR